MSTTHVTYSNPRLSADVPDWPSGRYRTIATFAVEKHPKGGERLVRVRRNRAPPVLRHRSRRPYFSGVIV